MALAGLGGQNLTLGRNLEPLFAARFRLHLGHLRLLGLERVKRDSVCHLNRPRG